MSTTADLDALAEALAADLYARANRAVFYTAAASQMSTTAWGDVYDQALVMLAAHMSARAPASAAAAASAATAAGPLTARSSGKWSESYGARTAGVANLSAGDAELMTTTYGAAFLRLRNSRAARVGTIVRVNASSC